MPQTITESDYIYFLKHLTVFKPKMKLALKTTLLLFSAFYLVPFFASGFGVLSHEAIVDAEWDHSILPLLKAKFPSASIEEQNEAHAYAYGGAVAPDMGYYPLGSKLFTNLVHYVRSGDMVDALLRDARNINEYAFALGFLSHYVADDYGHPLATNRSVPLVYPRLRKKYGNVITYGDNKVSHLRMEFGFDVLEVAKGNYASQAYRNFIGFKVDTAVLSKAFFETYGLTIDEVFSHHFHLGVETFRWIVANIFPVITREAWATKKHQILKQYNTANSKNFKFKMRRRQYNKQFGKDYKRPGFSAKMLSFFLRVIPKIGPLRALKFKPPTPQSEVFFDRSFDTILLHYSSRIKRLPQDHEPLRDIDFDTGLPTANCEYQLADQTYVAWLLRLNGDEFKNTNASIQKNIIRFFHLPAVAGSHSTLSKKCIRFMEAYHEIVKLDPQ